MRLSPLLVQWPRFVSALHNHSQRFTRLISAAFTRMTRVNAFVSIIFCVKFAEDSGATEGRGEGLQHLGRGTETRGPMIIEIRVDAKKKRKRMV